MMERYFREECPLLGEAEEALLEMVEQAEQMVERFNDRIEFETEFTEDEKFKAALPKPIDLDAAKELAYLLFSICEKRGWTQTALLFNGLGTSWSDLSAAARTGGPPTPPLAQGEFDFTNDEE